MGISVESTYVLPEVDLGTRQKSMESLQIFSYCISLRVNKTKRIREKNVSEVILFCWQNYRCIINNAYCRINSLQYPRLKMVAKVWISPQFFIVPSRSFTCLHCEINFSQLMLISVLFVLIRLFQKSNKQCGISINKKKRKTSILCLLGFCCQSSTSTYAINKALGETGFFDDGKKQSCTSKGFFVPHAETVITRTTVWMQ